MLGSLSKYYFISIFFIIIFTFLGFIFILNSTFPLSFTDNSSLLVSDSSFVWPTPNYSYITSYFGYRNSPFTGKVSYHSGIDIGAPNGANVLSSFSGTITYIGFSGANGYTVRVSNNTFEATYSHLSPYFIVYVGQSVTKGEVIAVVGPKNVYDVPNNPYKDSNGNPTNGSTTGPHLHFSIKKDR